jgi:hypothetical protein
MLVGGAQGAGIGPFLLIRSPGERKTAIDEATPLFVDVG